MASHEKIFSWGKMGSVQSHKYSFEILQLLRMRGSVCGDPYVISSS